MEIKCKATAVSEEISTDQKAPDQALKAQKRRFVFLDKKNWGLFNKTRKAESLQS